MDKSKIDFAGVVSGAKILVRPVDDAADGAAVAIAVNHNRNANV